MATNLIANGNFSDGDLHWTKGYWYAGNTVTWRSSGGQEGGCMDCLLYTSPSPRDRQKSRMPSSA